MAMLRSIDIEKGKAFAPDERRTAVLTEAALVGEAMARVNDFDKWHLPPASAGQRTGQAVLVVDRIRG